MKQLEERINKTERTYEMKPMTILMNGYGDGGFTGSRGDEMN